MHAAFVTSRLARPAPGVNPPVDLWPTAAALQPQQAARPAAPPAPQVDAVAAAAHGAPTLGPPPRHDDFYALETTLRRARQLRRNPLAPAAALIAPVPAAPAPPPTWRQWLQAGAARGVRALKEQALCLALARVLGRVLGGAPAAAARPAAIVVPKLIAGSSALSAAYKALATVGLSLGGVPVFSLAAVLWGAWQGLKLLATTAPSLLVRNGANATLHVLTSLLQLVEDAIEGLCDGVRAALAFVLGLPATLAQAVRHGAQALAAAVRQLWRDVCAGAAALARGLQGALAGAVDALARALAALARALGAGAAR